MRIIAVIIAFFYSLGYTFSQTHKVLDLNTGKINYGVEKTMPECSIEEVPDGIIVTYLFNKVSLQEDLSHKDSYFAKIEGFWQNHGDGEPATLLRWDTFIVPDTKVNIRMLDSTFIDIPIQLTVSRPIEWNSVPNHEKRNYIKDISVYNGMFPKYLIPCIRDISYRNQPLKKNMHKSIAI